MKKLLLSFIINLFLAIAGYAQLKLTLFYNGDIKDTVAGAAEILKQQLSKAVGFTYSQNQERLYKGTGILLSSQPANWPVYAAALKKMGPEGVFIKSNGKGVVIIGNSQLAVEHGIFIYLESLGYRFYFPHPDWYIIPSNLSLFQKIDYVGQPSFGHRKIWYGYGTGSKKSEADYNFWFKANRQGGVLNASFGQAYDDIVYRNEAEFKKHPEWLFPQPAKGTIPSDPKFNIANEELVQFVIADVIKRIEKSKKEGTQDYKMISLSPSDGPGVCNTPECQKYGSFTDRVFYLVNRVAKVVRQKYPGTWIGAYAYSEFNTPPNIALEPNVFVGITTAFNGSNYSVDELVQLWSKKAKVTGIYDYFSIYSWDQDVPGQSLAAMPATMINNIKKYYKMGAKGYEAESTTGWISKGLGHYLGAQLMWDINANTSRLRDDFFKLSFGKAAGAVQKLWKEFEKNPFTTPRQSDLAKWIDLCSIAEKQDNDKQVQARIFHIKSYLYYLTLLRRFKENKSESNLITLLNYGYRMMNYGSFAGYPSLFELGNLSVYPGMTFNDPKAKWKANQSIIGVQEISSLLALERTKLKEIKGLKEFSLGKTFINAPGAEHWKGAVHESQLNNMLWYPHDFIMQVTKQGKENYIDFSGNYVTGGDGKTQLKVFISEYKNPEADGETVLLSHVYAGHKTVDKISLASLKPGFYRVSVKDPLKIFKIEFSPSLNYSILVTPRQRLNSNFCNNLFVYVPKDVSNFAVWKSIEVKFQTPTGRFVDLTNKGEEEVEVRVLPGEAGLWKIVFFSGSLYLDGVPPVLGFNPSHMLVPAGLK